jgi:hypothetical protein
MLCLYCNVDSTPVNKSLNEAIFIITILIINSITVIEYNQTMGLESFDLDSSWTRVLILSDWMRVPDSWTCRTDSDLQDSDRLKCSWRVNVHFEWMIHRDSRKRGPVAPLNIIYWRWKQSSSIWGRKIYCGMTSQMVEGTSRCLTRPLHFSPHWIALNITMLHFTRPRHKPSRNSITRQRHLRTLFQWCWCLALYLDTWTCTWPWGF